MKRQPKPRKTAAHSYNDPKEFAKLVHALRNGDNAALETALAVVEPYTHKIINEKVHSNLSYLEDETCLVSDIKIRIIRGLNKSFKPGCKWQQWVAQITRNCITDAKKSADRRLNHEQSLNKTLKGHEEQDEEQHDLSAVEITFDAQWTRCFKTPRESAIEKETVCLVRKVLDGLRPEHKKLLMLAYMENMKHKNIALALHTRPEQIKQDIRCAKRVFAHGWQAISPGNPLLQ
ncbi:MAG: sigma-70 family RNA polymerase sigma factor [Candidatus Sumerlaeota bacterium]|nr:sigma-70 family RNA polymerase sigma factor [Candidatus Sumerlaeota bacterium]